MTTPRTRTRDERIDSYWTWQASPAPPTDSGTMTAGKVGMVKTITDENHPHFRKRMMRGEIIMGNLTLTSSSREFEPSDVTYVRQKLIYSDPPAVVVHSFGDGLFFWEPVIPINAPLGDDIPYMNDRVLVKAMAKITSNGVMTGEVLNDMSATITMLRRPFSGALKHLAKIRLSSLKRLKKSGSNAVEANASAWLEHRYGWKPLLLDAHQVIKNVHSFRERLFGGILVARAGEVRAGIRTTPFTDVVTGGILAGTGWKCSGSARFEREFRVNAGVVYSVANRTTSEQLSSDFRLGVDSLPQTVWECLPFSFVMDWFVQVGPWLEAVMPNPGVTTLGSWITAVEKCKKTYTTHSFVSRSNGTTITETGSIGSSCITTEAVGRIANPPLPTSPPMNFEFSSLTHAADGIALFVPRILRELKGLKH